MMNNETMRVAPETIKLKPKRTIHVANTALLIAVVVMLVITSIVMNECVNLSYKTIELTNEVERLNAQNRELANDLSVRMSKIESQIYVVEDDAENEEE